MGLNVSVLGVSGRMGTLVAEVALDNPDCTLVAATVRPGGGYEGKTVGQVIGRPEITLPALTEPSEAFKGADVVIDFTCAGAFRHYLDCAVTTKTPMLVGTTGLSPDDHAAMQDAAQHIPFLYAPNTSLIANTLRALSAKAATILNDGFDAEIFEVHHRGKVDAPSGLATIVGRDIAAARGVKFEDVAVMPDKRSGRTGPRKPGDIGYSVMRGGTIAGEHTVVFAGDEERFELTVRTNNRKVYATGAVKAAQWLVQQPNGLYDMLDVLGLKDC